MASLSMRPSHSPSISPFNMATAASAYPCFARNRCTPACRPPAARVDGVLQPPEVARMVLEVMEAERFLVLSHPQVAEYMLRKASSRERWLAGMRRLRDKIYGAP